MVNNNHPDSAMRGKHLLDITTGRIWPWTSVLSKKEFMKLYDEKNGADKTLSQKLKEDNDKLKIKIVPDEEEKELEGLKEWQKADLRKEKETKSVDINGSD